MRPTAWEQHKVSLMKHDGVYAIHAKPTATLEEMMKADAAGIRPKGQREGRREKAARRQKAADSGFPNSLAEHILQRVETFEHEMEIITHS
jgi:hypothetical protein